MKKIKYIVIASLFGAFFTGCDDYLDINTNPDTSTTIIPEQSLPIVVFYAAQENYDHAEYGNYLSQALTTGGKSQTGTYAYKSGWEFLTMNRHPQWRRHFYDIGINVRELIKASEKMESSNFALIARTVRLMSTQLTTDVFGDMPLTEAYTGTSPKYDTQESIYAWMLQEADALIADYDNPALTQNPKNVQITPKMDRIFAGDLAKWKQFTIGLKARILLRKLPNWDNTPATCQQIIKTVDAALNGWTEPIYKYDGGTAEANCPWSKAQPSIGGWESRKNELDKAIPSEYLIKDMFGLKGISAKRPYGDIDSDEGSAEDPRLESYMTPRKIGKKVGMDSGDERFRFLKNNIGMDISYKETNFPELYTSPYNQSDGYVSLMLTEELLFIKAEALYWKGDKTGSHSVTVEAVKKNMERLTPTDEAKAYKYKLWVANFFKNAKLNAKYLPQTGFHIGHLMRQKYMAMLFQPELWNDMRRYCYSNATNGITYDGDNIYRTLRRPYNLYEAYWIEMDGEKVKEDWIQRLNYDPETEEKYNVAELKRLGAYKNFQWLKKPMIWAVNNGSHN